VSAPIEALLAGARVLPVLTFADAAAALPVARALAEGGLRAIEVTLRTPAAPAAIRAIVEGLPGMAVGAGTVLGAADLARAQAAGAAFVVTPGTPASLLDALVAGGPPAIPGVASVSEMIAARARGFHLQKLFPAEALGGRDMLRAVAPVLPDLAFCPTGGIDGANAADYLALPNVACVGGSWIAPVEAIATGDLAGIRARARAAATL